MRPWGLLLAESRTNGDGLFLLTRGVEAPPGSLIRVTFLPLANLAHCATLPLIFSLELVDIWRLIHLRQIEGNGAAIP